MVLTEYDEQATMESFKKEYLEKGKEECIKNMRNVMQNGNYSFEEAAKLLGYTVEEISNIMNGAN